MDQGPLPTATIGYVRQACCPSALPVSTVLSVLVNLDSTCQLLSFVLCVCVCVCPCVCVCV